MFLDFDRSTHCKVLVFDKIERGTSRITGVSVLTLFGLGEADRSISLGSKVASVGETIKYFWSVHQLGDRPT